MDKGKLIEDMEKKYNSIFELRKEIADLKANKSVKRSKYWELASGTAKEKEDYVKSMVADIDKDIQLKEAEIQYHHDMIEILDFKLVYCDE